MGVITNLRPDNQDVRFVMRVSTNLRPDSRNARFVMRVSTNLRPDNQDVRFVMRVSTNLRPDNQNVRIVMRVVTNLRPDNQHAKSALRANTKIYGRKFLARRVQRDGIKMRQDKLPAICVKWVSFNLRVNNQNAKPALRANTKMNSSKLLAMRVSGILIRMRCDARHATIVLPKSFQSAKAN